MFFRIFTSKSKMDTLLDIHSKAVISLNAIENVYIEDSVILSKLRDIVRNGFHASKQYLNQWHNDIVIDIDSVKIGHIDQMIEQQYRIDKEKSHLIESVPLQTELNININNQASNKIIASSSSSSSSNQNHHHRSKFVQMSTPADFRSQWQTVSSISTSPSVTKTTSTMRPTVSANIVRVGTHSTVTLLSER